MSGRFVKVLVRGMKKAGQYRGEGTLQVTEAGIAIKGKHVYSLGQRWLFGIGLSLAVAVLTAGTFAPGILLIYPVVEYLWLKRGDQLIPFDRVMKYQAVPKKELIAIEFSGTPWETPVVLKSESWKLVYDALVARKPAARAQ